MKDKSFTRRFVCCTKSPDFGKGMVIIMENQTMDTEIMDADPCIESVIKQYSDMVYHLAFVRTGSKQDADDIFQEVFLRLVKKRPAFHEEEHRKAWLIRVTINCSRKFWSSSWQKRTQPLLTDLVFENQEHINLHHELQKLPPKYREVIHLFYYENMSLNEMSEVLHRKNTTIRTQLNRARNLLRDFMKEEDYV